MELSPAAVRALLLAAQSLAEPRPLPATKGDALAAIRQMGVLQIDTIHVVARSPYLVLWSRLGPYDPRWLDQLLAEGALFEYWSHAACFLPIEEFALYRGRMLAARSPEGRGRNWTGVGEEMLARVLAHVREHGPVRSADFARDGRGGPWWDWKPEKAALELLFDQGHLMIARRENFQRVYDLQERVLPGWDDAATLPPDEVRRRHVLNSVRALGVAPARWVADYFRIAKRGLPQILEALAAEGLLLRIGVAGWPDPAYLHPANLALAERAAAGELRATRTTLLSPFDPVVWDRARALELYDFHYRIEVYTPAERRAFGYFTLPILHGDRVVGRLDPKAHRHEGRFEVRGLHLEPGVPLADELVDGLAAAVADCAAWHGTPAVTLSGRSDPPELAAALRARLPALA
ncbi:MAG TPA: crosslink repair DNA glycosylase YcaQ family protein [Chloroflexaceae bacterium]|nr:crosslink repair DNA glycosylase YcaQ family protein [Chloroflexaceae bacterium]